MGSMRCPAFLLVLLYTGAVQVTEEVIKMSLFPEAVDYSFTSCRQEMLELVTKDGGLLQNEFNKTKDFRKMWKSNSSCKKRIPGGTAEHMTALQLFVVDEAFQKQFNKALQKSTGISTYHDDFPFKSIFFLVADAMGLLKQNCSTVYFGIDNEYEGDIGRDVRFKSFLPVKQKLADVTEDAELGEGIGTVFIIRSCSVINLEDDLCETGEMEFLISPNELFRVENIRTVKNNFNGYKEITLNHSDFHSFSNCSGLESVPYMEETKESSSSVLSCISLNLMVSFLMVYILFL